MGSQDLEVSRVICLLKKVTPIDLSAKRRKQSFEQNFLIHLRMSSILGCNLGHSQRSFRQNDGQRQA